MLPAPPIPARAPTFAARHPVGRAKLATAHRLVQCPGRGVWFARLLLLVAALLGTHPLLHAAPTTFQWTAPALPPAAARTQPLGPLAATNELRLSLGLPLPDPAGCARFARDLYDPAHPQYHQFLTPAAFTARFGPAAADYARLTAWAESRGLRVAATHASRLVLEVRGPVAAVESAFQVTLHRYRHPTEAREFFAPAGPPAVVLPLPGEVHGLSDYARQRPAAHRQRPRPGPAGGSAPGGNYLGRDFRRAYAPGVTLDGTGQMVGLVEFDGYQASDIAAYTRLAGLPPVPLINVPVAGFDAPDAASAEVSLDIEMALSMAPGLAAIVVFEAPASGYTTLPLLDTLSASNQINQFSCSWGLGSSQSIDAVQLKLAAQGQTFLYASGDSDAYVSPQTVWMESPFGTSVGGTVLTTTGPDAAYAGEVVWNVGATGSGGGVSDNYALPAWQVGVATAANQGSNHARNSPDVALTAADIWVCYGGGLAASFQGTSCAAPLWAGFAALVNQQAAAYGRPPVGFLNPALYALAGSDAYAACFQDITHGNNASPISPDRYAAGPGYDLCTGLGTPRCGALILALSGPPVVTAPPADLILPTGGTGAFVAAVGGAPPLAYQWQFNGQNLPGATATTLVISNVQPAEVGLYTVAAANAYGAVTSAPAKLILTLPVITVAPQDQIRFPPYLATFTVTVADSGPLTYQWQFHGTNLPDNNLISTLAGDGTANPYGDGGPAVAAALDFPTGVAVDATGNLFIADSLNHRIRRVDTNQVITTVAGGGRGSPGFGGDSGPAFAALLNNPTGVAVDALGNVFVADYFNHRIRRVDPQGIIHTHAGNGVGGYAGDGGPATVAHLHYPAGVAVDPAGNLFIADSGNNRIRCVAPGGLITTVAGNGGAGGGGQGDGGPATNAVLYAPLGVGLNARGDLFIADTSNNHVRRVDAQGIITSVAGGGSGTDGGLGANAFLYHPRGVACDPFGNLYIAEYGLHRVRRIGPDGIITTFAGNGALAAAGDGGPAARAAVSPAGVACDAGGNWFIADADNNRIRGVPQGGSPVLIVAPVTVLDAGPYDVVVSNPRGSVTSTVAILTVPVAPLLTVPPANQSVAYGGTAELTVTAAGSGPFNYQWLDPGGNVIQDGPLPTLLLPNVNTNTAGTYQVIVSNPFGATPGPPAQLTVTIPRTPPLLGAGLLPPPAGPAARFTLQITAAPGQTIVIETSPDLRQWLPLATNFTTRGAFLFQDPAPVTTPHRYYRARLQ